MKYPPPEIFVPLAAGFATLPTATLVIVTLLVTTLPTGSEMLFLAPMGQRRKYSQFVKIALHDSIKF